MGAQRSRKNEIDKVFDKLNRGLPPGLFSQLSQWEIDEYKYWYEMAYGEVQFLRDDPHYYKRKYHEFINDMWKKYNYS